MLITTWFTVVCNTHIAQNQDNQPIKFGQLIEYNKYFSSKIMQKMWQRYYFQTSLFLKKLNMRWKQVVCSLVLVYFDSPQLVM